MSDDYVKYRMNKVAVAVEVGIILSCIAVIWWQGWGK